MKNDNESFEREEKLKYFGTTLWIKIPFILKSGNACYHLVQHLLLSSLLSKNIKIKICRTIISPVVLYRCETWLPTLREERRLRVFENRVLRRIFVPKRDILIVTGLECEAFFMEGLTCGRYYFLGIAFSVEVIAIW